MTNNRPSKSKRAISLFVFCLLIMLTQTFNCHALAAGAGAKTFFQTSSGGFTIQWNSKNLSASAGAAPANVLFSAAQIARAEKPKKSSKTTVDRSFQLLSVVGPILSYQDESSLDWPGMAHPGVGDVRFYHAIDLRKPTKKCDLGELFAATDIYNAMMAAKSVKQSLQESHSRPKTLAQLMRAIQDTNVDTTDADGNGVRVMFNRDMLSQFCFNKVTPNNVDLSISLYDQANNQISPMRLNLPLKGGELAKWLADADSKKAGVLADKMTKIAGEATTDFHFDP